MGIAKTYPVLRTSITLPQYQLICSNAVEHDEMFLLFHTEDGSSARVWVISINTYIDLGQERRAPRATSRPLDTDPPDIFEAVIYFEVHSLAVPDTKRVGRGLILYRDRRTIVT